jgi:hypothetical protein
MTAEQIAVEFSKRFATPEELAVWLQLLDRFFGTQIATANARVARQDAANATQQAETAAQQAEAAARAAQAEFDTLAAALAASA